MVSSFKVLCLVSLMLVMSCGKTGGIAPSSVIAPTTGSTCGGAVVGGFCWYYGTINQSCDDVCATHGGYNAATVTYAGSSGLDVNCQNVLDALGVASFTFVGAADCGTFGYGCSVDVGGEVRLRCATPATTSSGGNPVAMRACACNE